MVVTRCSLLNKELFCVVFVGIRYENMGLGLRSVVIISGTELAASSWFVSIMVRFVTCSLFLAGETSGLEMSS